MAEGGAATEVWPVWLQDQRVQRALEWADHVQRWIKINLYGLVLHAPDPDHMAAVAFAVVYEHQASAALLVRHGLLGSATALMRPSFEVFVRGLWLQWANDQELAHFQKGHDTAVPEKMISKVVQRSGVQRYADLLDTWSRSQKTMHGYVHHGYQSLIRLSGIIDTPPEEVVDLLGFSTSMALHASLETVDLAGRRVPEDEVATRPQWVADKQLEIVAMLRAMGLVQMLGKAAPTPPTFADDDAS
ncbi:DUF6988 family protein [Lysobacter enzymogenes]|uniref:DUF6988 family protein n=1 Tax=Lysobacter enzymogenes TaxID=69 RepID=UPI00089739A3|nr:hypothetical protein [Lysobacter enzymogenes]SDW86086.1 hypothetical protein SAMN05421681_10342 [Lysobacter enzymogenes]